MPHNRDDWKAVIMPFGRFAGHTLEWMSENAGDYTIWISRQSTDRRISKHLAKAADAVEARRTYGTKPKYKSPDRSAAFAAYKAAALPRSITNK